MDLAHHRAGSGPPLVLIHGIGSHWQIWTPVLEALEQHHEVIALDLPGFGASPLPAPGTAPGVDSLVALTTEFLTDLGLHRPHVAGNSLGGLIALEMARRGLARSATGISPAGFASPAEQRLAAGALWLSVRAARRLSARADALRSPAVRVGLLGGLVAHPTRLSGEEAVGSVRALAAAPWFDATLPTIGPMHFRGGDAITVPVTIAWGAKDRLLLPRQAVRAAREIPTAQLVGLPDCGHVPTYDDPALVARVILDGAKD